MESLGTILTRIFEKSKDRQDSGLNVPPEPEAEVCPRCNGACFVSRHARVGDPDFGRGFPCPDCVNVSEMARKNREKYSGLPTKNRKSFHDFFARNGTETALESVRKFPQKDGASMLTLCGPNGTGKTHLMVALGLRLLAEDVAVRYAFVPDLLDELRSCYGDQADETAEQVLARYRGAEVLLLDDIAEWRVTEFAAEKIGQLVDDRYRNGTPLVVSTNMTLQPMARLWGPRLADRVFDGRNPQVDVVYLNCESHRTGTKWQPPQGRR